MDRGRGRARLLLSNLIGLLTVTGTATAARAHPPLSASCDCRAEIRTENAERIRAVEVMVQEQEAQLRRIEGIERTLTDLHDELAKSLAASMAATGVSAIGVVDSIGGRVRVTLKSELLFQPSSARVTRAGRDAVSTVGVALGGRPIKAVEVVGHTDDRKPNRKYEDNWQLSGERARRVLLVLVDAGVPVRLLSTTGRGEAEPADPADTEQARAKNRRVEIFVTPADPIAKKL